MVVVIFVSAILDNHNIMTLILSMIVISSIAMRPLWSDSRGNFDTFAQKKGLSRDRPACLLQ